MLFNSFEFILVFLPVFVVTYYLAVRIDQRLALGVIIVSSLFFYAWWYFPNLFLLVGSILVNFAIGRFLAGPSLRPASRRLLLTFGILFNLGLIALFKYANFILETANLTFGVRSAAVDIVLPLAISFFTFQQIAFLLDVYRGDVKRPQFLTYVAFVTFFPQLIAGPIVKYGELAPQLQHRTSREGARRSHWPDINVGLAIFAFGLFKKVVLADNLAVLSDPMFATAAAGEDPTMIPAWLAVFAFTFQIYFDFSGYSDMAVGLARIAGYRLPINFNSPYKARNISEFWRRWHMTLTRFFTSTIFTPLALRLARAAGSWAHRPGSLPGFLVLTAPPIVVTFLLVGLWHGAGWTFVLFGACHAAYLVTHRFVVDVLLGRAGRRGTWTYRLGRAPGVALTFVAVAVSFVLFRAENMDAAMIIYANMFQPAHLVLPESVRGLLSPLPPLFAVAGVNYGDVALWQGTRTIIWLSVSACIVFALHNTMDVFQRYRPAIGYRQVGGQQFDKAIGRLPSATAWGAFLAVLIFWVVSFFQEEPAFIAIVPMFVTAFVGVAGFFVLISLPATSFRFQWRVDAASLLATAAVLSSALYVLFTGTKSVFIYFAF